MGFTYLEAAQDRKYASMVDRMGRSCWGSRVEIVAVGAVCGIWPLKEADLRLTV